MQTPLKLNLGCGFRKKEGFVNIDSDGGCMPDLQLDLATEAWPQVDSCADEMVFEYSLEQMGSGIGSLAHVIMETYRVAADKCKISIIASHPRHDQFFLNPANTHRLSPDFFQLLAIGRNLEMISAGLSHDVFGLKWGVNFEVIRVKFLIATAFQDDVQSGRISETEIRTRMTHENNICQAFEVDLIARKEIR